MKRNYWLVSLATALAVFAAGCGGLGEKPADTEQPATPPVAPTQAEAGGAESLPFEVIKESMLPAELASWTELTQPPKSTGSARVGDFLYVLVTGGTESIGASAIVPTKVELTEKPTPVITVAAVITPGKDGAEIMTFPKAYIRIPYAASRPVPGVMTTVQWESAKAEPATGKGSAADPSTPVSSPASSGSGQGESAATGAVTMLTESALPASLSAWRESTVQVPNGVARYVDGALYLMVSGGQRSTGGYSVEIRSVSVKEKTVFVSAVLHSPKAGQMVTQAITYPKAYAKVDLPGSGEPGVIVDWQ